TRVTEIWDVEQLPPAMQQATPEQLEARARYTEDMLINTLAAIKARPCTCTLRINTPGSPTDRHKDKKVYMRGLAWHPSAPLPPGDALDAGHADARRAPSGSLPLLLPTTTAGSHPRGLRPRRHPIQQHLAQRPDVVRQSSGHGGRPWLPAL